jgi:hypothetical protein
MVLIPMVSAVATFLVFVINGGIMTPLTVFTTLALLYVIRFPVTTIPLSIAAWVQVPYHSLFISLYLFQSLYIDICM